MATKKTTSKSKASSTKKLSEDDIRNRAQAIYEKRVENGVHGDAHSDWVQAEKELKKAK